MKSQKKSVLKNTAKMSQDIVSDALNQMMNSKKAGKSVIEVKRYSKFLISVLALAKLKNYVKDYKISDNKKALKIEVAKLNKCQAIKPRFTVSIEEIEKYEKRYLPAKNFGILIISTSQGLMTNQTAKEKKIGGSLIAFIY